jgi:hypothetical protein
MKDRGRSLPARPRWLDDEPEVLALLHAFLDLLEQKPLQERARPPAIKLSPGKMPRLYRHDEAADRTWVLMKSLNGRLYQVRPDRRRAPYDPEYAGASLRWLEPGEPICRAWLSRPGQPAYTQQWAAAVAQHARAFADTGVSLRGRPLKVPGRTADQVVRAFARLGEAISGPVTLRQLSARCFWGHSKLLDSRADLLAMLHPDLRIAPRPVLVQFRLPETCGGVLFIENQDSYVQALAGTPAAATGLALVYAAGFKGGAERIRTPGGVSLHCYGDCPPAPREVFERWWQGGHEAPWPLWFWGDLDYAGMGILKLLRQRFGDVRAWPPGYAPLLQMLESGEGHVPEIADKAEQQDPLETGCEFADTRLLPAIRREGRFLDQEVL